MTMVRAIALYMFMGGFFLCATVVDMADGRPWAVPAALGIGCLGFGVALLRRAA